MAHRRTARPEAPQNHLWGNHVTEILPIHEFGSTAALTEDRSPFATDVEILTAPELDDANDLADEWPLLLLAPFSATSAARSSRQAPTCLLFQKGSPRQGLDVDECAPP